MNTHKHSLSALEESHHDDPHSCDPQSAALILIQRVKVLQDIYERETGALEAAQVEVFMALQEEKLAAASAYQDAMKRLLEQKAQLSGALAPSLRAQLIVMQKDFAALTERNKQALERMQRCVARLSEKICALAKTEVMSSAPVGYGPCGGQSSAAASVRSVSTSEGEVV